MPSFMGNMPNPPTREKPYRQIAEDIFYIFIAIIVLYMGAWHAVLGIKAFFPFLMELISGVLISFFLFFFGLALTNLSISTAVAKFKGSLHPPYPYYQSFISRIWLIPLEELFWRAFLISLLPARVSFFLLISLGFSLSHFKLRFDPLNILKYLDLFFLSLALCYLYAYTKNIYLVILIHTLRNILVTLNIHYNKSRKRKENQDNHHPALSE